MDKTTKARAFSDIKSVFEYINRLELQIHQLHGAVKENHEWHQQYDEHGGYAESGLEQTNKAGLMVPLPQVLTPYPTGMVLRNKVEVGVDSVQHMTRVVKAGAEWVVSSTDRNDRTLRCRTYNTWLDTDVVELAENFTIISIE